MIRVNGKRVYESRYVARANYNEIVHHIDHNPKNNSPSNLIRLNRADHLRLHKPTRWGHRADR